MGGGKSMNPKVSVIVPVYNAEQYITRCINSILDQTYQNMEIIIINDGSKDNSEQCILTIKEKQKDKIRYYKQNNSGVAKTRNLGIRFSNRNLYYVYR